MQVQGRLTTGSGAPAQGNFTITARLFATPSGGTPLLEQKFNNVAVAGGLFDAMLDPVPATLVQQHGLL